MNRSQQPGGRGLSQGLSGHQGHRLGPWNWALRLLLAALLLAVGWRVLDWAVLQAVFQPDLAACRAALHQGACWGVVVVKGADWLFGPYPVALRGQASVALVLWGASMGCAVAALLASRRCLYLAAGALWLVALGSLAGVWPGQTSVPSRDWGGLSLTVVLATSAWLCSVVLGALLAWGRLHAPGPIRAALAAFIELVRGVPLVMWLFMAAFLLPRLWPASGTDGALPRVWLVMTLFAAVYAAEILRGAWGVLGSDQIEAARVLGAGEWTAHRRVVLPQVFQTALPPLISHGIGFIKDTSLVMIVNLQDFTGAMSVSLNGDADWRTYFLEAYLVVAAVYAALCLLLAWVGHRLEARHAEGGVASA